MAKDGANLLGEGKFEKVSYRPALQKSTSIYIRGFEDFDSRKEVLNNLMEALTSTDVNLIGVYGMGGVGKTTLVKRVYARAIEEKLFDVVVMVEVTQTPDLKKLQEDIADSLELKFQEVGVSGRADRLRSDETRSSQQKEDWKGRNDDMTVGIPLGGDEKGNAQQKEDCEERNDDLRQCKILLTSRNLHVLCNHMNVQKNFYVHTLSNKEAWNMFVKIVGDTAKNCDFNGIAVQVVQKCAGLPVAVATIANALKNKSDLVHWKDASRQLGRPIPGDIEGLDADVYSAIKLSYNFLENEEAKSIFLLCGLENAGYNISIEDLLRYCMGLGLFNDVDTLEEALQEKVILISFKKCRKNPFTAFNKMSLRKGSQKNINLL
ncbi:hypothetical protein LWI29_021900 [Acer saccharum]|uniref:NB-ARC domain-containing protein n=1 Tax=Acer saccharum TaxID=4024 RepID=A0AA39TC21_ACESA|nr:hypothetical protein LWI29_021900 [Acer saccharum]